MSNPTIVNSNPAANGGPAQGDHSRKASVTIGANGVSGYPPNGGPVAPSSKSKNIVFGQQADSSANSPAQSSTAPANASASAGAPPQDLHVTEPTSEPLPIPSRPSASGGPPTSYHSQTGSVNFGSMDNPGNPNTPIRHGHQFSGQHIRRDSSHSGLGSDMGVPMAQTPSRGGYRSGRGGQYQQQGGFYNNNNNSNNHIPHQSPAQGYRQMNNQQRSGNMPPHFAGQGMPPFQGSPHYPQPRSPGYTGGSNPGTPQMQHPQMANQQHMGYQQQYGAYPNQMNPNQQMYPGGPQQYDPNYQMYYPQQPHMQYSRSPGQPYQQAPPTPRQQSYMHNQYSQPSAHPMSRTPSQMSTDRPPSSVGGGSQGPPPSMAPHASQSSHTPSLSTSSASVPSSANFTIPSRTKKAIVIKDADGNVFTPGAAVASSVKAPSSAASTPAPVPTPPPQSTTPSHHRSESKTGKTAEEVRAEFLSKVKAAPSGEKRGSDETAVIKEESEAPAAPAAVEATKPAAEIVEAAAPTHTVTEPAAPADTPADTPAEPEAVPEKKLTPEEEAAEKKRLEDEEFERMVKDMEEEEAKRELKEKEYQETKRLEKEAEKEKEKERMAKADEAMKQAERDAEAAELEREKKKKSAAQGDDSQDSKDLFAELKKPTVGPGAEQDDAETPKSEDSPADPSSTSTPQQSGKPAENKPKQAGLKLDTKPAEPAKPTLAMNALRNARAIKVEDEVTYPEGVSAPVVQRVKRAAYDKAFLAQFMDRFKEKPTIDWDAKLKEVIGDPSDSAKGGRTPGSAMGGRAASGRGPPPQQQFNNPMGSFGAAGRPVPRTSEARFAESQRGPMQNPLGPFVQNRGGFPMPGGMGMPMARSGSAQNMSHGPARGGASQRGRGESGRGSRVPSRKEQDHMNKSMPLTAGADLKPLQATGVGWKPMSIGKPPQVAAAETSGHMAPEMVQRKVKSNLNKMTPERFDKIADQILVIAAQSKDETDGRTLRQVIALTFEKACDESHWASMYAKFCQRMLEGVGPEVRDDNVKDKAGNATVGGLLFRKYLLNRCQEEFESGWSLHTKEKEGEEEAGETRMMSEEYYKEAAIKRKGLGLVKFIGELYKLGMLSTRIMHQCVHKLLDFEGMPEESSIESLTQFLSTVGGMMEASDAKNAEMMKAYFERIEKIMSMPGLPSRMRFMLMDLIDLRRQGWHSKNSAKGPKTIQEIHAEEAAKQAQAAQEAERQRQSQRGNRMTAGRGDARNFSGNQPPVDYARSQVASDDLRRLSSKAGRTTSSGPAKTLGPSSMFASRSSSGRGNLPGGLLNRGEESSSSSRAPSQRAEKKEEDTAAKNTFEALAHLDGEGGDADPTSPAASKATPATEPAAVDTPATNA